jgi:tetratricopeptide (TPR) repeat protein
MQDQPLIEKAPRRFRVPPVVVAIIAYLVLITVLLGLVGSIVYRPLLARYHYSRGYSSSQRKQFDNALADFTEAVRLDPTFAIAFYARGHARSEKRQFDTAIADFTEAVRLQPRFEDAYFARAFARNEMNQFDDAITDYGEAIRLNPRNAAAFVNRAYIHSAKKDFPKAIADNTSAIQLNPREADFFKYRGFALSMTEEYDKALADYTEAIQLNHDDPFPHVSIAWIRINSPDERIRDAKLAVASATTACELSQWRYPSYLETLAAACGQLGDFESAAKWQTKANLLHSNSKEKAEGEQKLRFYRTRMGQEESWTDDAFPADAAL